MNKFQGFSLLEFLMVFAFVAIISTFSFASYQQTMIKMRRHDAKLALLELAENLETYYSFNQTYELATVGRGKTTDIGEEHSAEGWYRVVLVNLSKNSYSIAAIPLESQRRDKQCQTFTYNHLGQKGVIDSLSKSPLPSSLSCWN